MRKLKVIIILSVFILISQYSYAEGNKYQTLLFPDGMPIKEGLDGKKRKMVYEFYSEIQIPGRHGLLILYSVKTIAGFSDDQYTVYLTSISKKKNKLHIVATENITKYITTFTEVPGNFYQMDGIIETFKINETKVGIHINLWAIISGSGSISSSTDLFYLVEPDFELKLLLRIKDSSSFSKLRREQYKSKNTYLYFGDIKGDGNNEILLLNTEYKVDSSKNIYNFSLSPQVKVYHFDENSFVFYKDLNMFEKDIPKLRRVKKSEKIIYPRIPLILRKLFDNATEN